MNNRDNTASYFRVAASFAICGMIILIAIYLPDYIRGGRYFNLIIPIAICAVLILLSIPLMNYIKKVWADNSDAGYFQAANLLAIFSMVSFILIRLPEYVSRELYLKAAVLSIAVLGAIAVMIIIMVSVKKITTLAFWIPLVIFISYTAGTIYLRGAFYYFLVYLVICGIGASYYDYKKMFRFMLLSNIVILVLIYLRAPLLGEGAAFNDTLVAWIITVYISIFLLMLSRFSTDKSGRAAKALDSFSTLMAATPNLVALVDEMNRVTYISRPLAVWAHIEDHEMAIGRPLIDLFHEMDMKIVIGEILLTEGAYEGTKELKRNDETIYFKIIANDLRGSARGKFIDISDITPIMEARLEAERAASAKSNFLANTSHEIRTPMNAIIGLSELALREELPPQVRDHVGNIKQAGNNLLALINDILDFSKIESGKIEIAPSEYMFASIINDCISIIRTRLGEKPVQFITQIDGSLPAKMFGDEMRLRQILLNLLSNAVKYTREGSITFTVHSGVSPETSQDGLEMITLLFEIADTGIGIKSEDMGRLFGTFEQMDTKSNRGIEGTGLGLAISRDLCRLMGGDISVESEYGKGSTFIASIPQTVLDSAPFAFVEDPETKNALIYIEGKQYGESILYTLDNMGVGCSFVKTRDDFIERLENVEWQFVFTSPDIFDDVREILQKKGSSARLILITEYGKAARPDVHTLEAPVQPVSVANILNGKAVDTGHHEIEDLGVRFTAPDARILIVDDIETNLDVAAGLLAPYKMRIDKSTGGRESIELAAKNKYDLIFMDHMMPEMDGIEAVEKIREWEESIRKNGEHSKGVPIIALTANAVSGMKEIFLEKGFNDYLSKPIEITKLDAVISRWIPLEKRTKTGETIKRESVNGNSGFSIPGIDTSKGINMTGGTLDGYKNVLTLFRKDVLERMPLLSSAPAPESLAAFTTSVHAIKSAAGSIGTEELSKEAAELEAAGKAGDVNIIEEKLPGFYEHLSETAENIGAALAENAPDAGSGGGPLLDISDAAVHGLFAELKIALETKDMEAIDRLVEELAGKGLDKKTAGTLNAVSDLLLVSKFKAALETINTLLDGTAGMKV